MTTKYSFIILHLCFFFFKMEIARKCVMNCFIYINYNNFMPCINKVSSATATQCIFLMSFFFFCKHPWLFLLVYYFQFHMTCKKNIASFYVQYRLTVFHIWPLIVIFLQCVEWLISVITIESTAENHSRTAVWVWSWKLGH